MTTSLCETSLETVNFIGVNDTEEHVSKWMIFCKSVHVHKCNATSMGINKQSFDSMFKYASHHDCFSHVDSETVYWISIVLSFIIIFANSFIMVIFSKNQHLQTINNIPLFSLAVSDLLIGLIFMYSASWSLLLVYARYDFDVHRHFVYNTIRSNYYLCLTFEGPVMIFISLMSSILTLLLIAMERYIAVIHTYLYHKIITRERVVGSVALIWLLSITIGILPIAGWNTYNGVCAMNELLSASYIQMWSTVCFISAAFMLFMYLRIFHVANKHRNQIHSLHQSISWNFPQEQQKDDDLKSVASSLSTDWTELENKEQNLDQELEGIKQMSKSQSRNLKSADCIVNRTIPIKIDWSELGNTEEKSVQELVTSKLSEDHSRNSKTPEADVSLQNKTPVQILYKMHHENEIETNLQEKPQNDKLLNKEAENQDQITGSGFQSLQERKKLSKKQKQTTNSQIQEIKSRYLPTKLTEIEHISTDQDQFEANIFKTKQSRGQNSPDITNQTQTTKLQIPSNKNLKNPSPPIFGRRESKSHSNKQTQSTPTCKDPKLSRKAIKTTGMIIGSFYLCWFPFLIYIILYTMECCKDKETLYYFAVITQLNSLFNPIVYGYRQSDIKMAAFKLLRLKNRACYKAKCENIT